MYEENEVSTAERWSQPPVLLDSVLESKPVSETSVPECRHIALPVVSARPRKWQLFDQCALLVTRLNTMLRNPAYEATNWQGMALQGRIRNLEDLVRVQVEQIERLGRLRQFLSPAVADVVLNAEDELISESYRREIAAICCDLRGFTAFTEKADPDETVALLRDYHREVVTLIAEFDGTIDHFAGDGVLAFLNAPVECEDPARRAVELAVAMRVKVRSCIRKWRSRGFDLGFGVGITFGPASVGLFGHQPRLDYAATGSSVNLAARLCQKAKDGQILICANVKDAIREPVKIEFVGELDMKGFSQPIPAHNIL